MFFLAQDRKLFLQLLDLLIEAIVTLLEFVNGDSASYTDFQQTVLFGVNSGQVFFKFQSVTLIVVFIWHGLDHLHHRLYDGLLILSQLIENPGHNLIQLRGTELRS